MVAWPFASGAAAPVNDGPAFRLLEERAATIGADHSKNGWAYVISGSLVVAASVPLYFSSDDLFARAVYSLGQTIGVASVGYGSYLVLVPNEYSAFLNVVRDSPSVGPAQREELARAFLRRGAERGFATRRIRVITHGLTGALNFFNGFTASQRELKTALFFVGGINVLAVLNYGLKRSDEEKLTDGEGLSAQLEPVIVPAAGGGLLGVRWSF